LFHSKGINFYCEAKVAEGSATSNTKNMLLRACLRRKYCPNDDTNPNANPTSRAWPNAHLLDCPDCQLFRLWEQPIVSVTDWILTYWIRHIWRFDYEHNYIKVAQLHPPVTEMVTGSINSLYGNQILSSFLSFCLLKIA